MKFTKYKKFKLFARRNFPMTLNRIFILLRKYDRTYGGELKLLNEIVDLLPENSIQSFVDIGSGDGFNMSSSYFLVKSGRRGLLIDGDPIAISHARKIYKNLGSTTILCLKLNPGNITRVLSDAGYSHFDYLKIDIDSFDLTILNQLLRDGFRPKVFSIEINERIPPSIYFDVKYTRNGRYNSKVIYGCSIASANDVASKFNYSLYSIAYNNAFFIQTSLLKMIDPAFNKSIKDIYLEGYVNAPERVKLFPWNSAFDSWMYADSDNLLNEIRSEISKIEPNFPIDLGIVKQ